MGTYGKSRADREARFVRRVGIVTFLVGVVVFTYWFSKIVGVAPW